MKRVLPLLIAFMMLMTGTLTAQAEEPEIGKDTGEEGYVFPEYSYDELTVGNPTPVEGNFFTDMWGNNTSDLDVRELLHGYDLIAWDTENGMYVTNPTVVAEDGLVELENDSGDRMYLITLYSDLKYSDGTPITARDYAFTLLMETSPVIRELGGTPLRLDYIDGYSEYVSGESAALRGVRIQNDTQLQITVRHEYLPFFYELGLLSCRPYPIHVIAPGCTVRDDGEGAYIDGPFTADLLQKTVMDPGTGYRSHPGVVCGPYTLTSFDGTVCEFEKNPYYKGNEQGIIPMIRKLRLVPVENDTMIAQLGAGEVGLLNKVTRADVITQAGDLISTGYYASANYPRVGLTFISFNCERPGLGSQAVRQAIAHCLDKDQVITDYTGYHGLRVDGYYGMGQWMYQLLSGTILPPVEEPEEQTSQAQREYEETLAAWAELSLDDIPKDELNVAEAVRLLEQEGWVPGADGIRTRDGVSLRMTLAYPQGNNVGDSLERNFAAHLREAGIELTLQPMEMSALLDQFYHRGERTADMLYLGSNFDIMFDPAAHFQYGESMTPAWDYTQAEDEELYQLALSMRQTEPGDLLGYCRKWLAFQQRFAEVKPMIPLYSNVYFDYFPTILHHYYPSAAASWTEAVLSAYLGDAEDAAEEEPGEGEALFDDF